MVDIFVRVGGNAVVRLLKDFLPRPEPQTISRASLDASRSDYVVAIQRTFLKAQRLPVARQRDRRLGPVRTMSALLYLRGQRVPFRRGYSPGARPDAVTAADAFVRIVDDGPIRPAIQGRCRTGRGTCWFQAVQTSPHSEQVVQASGSFLIGELMKSDQRERVCAESGRVLKAQ